MMPQLLVNGIVSGNAAGQVSMWSQGTGFSALLRLGYSVAVLPRVQALANVVR